MKSPLLLLLIQQMMNHLLRAQLNQDPTRRAKQWSSKKIRSVLSMDDTNGSDVTMTPGDETTGLLLMANGLQSHKVVDPNKDISTTMAIAMRATTTTTIMDTVNAAMKATLVLLTKRHIIMKPLEQTNWLMLMNKHAASHSFNKIQIKFPLNVDGRPIILTAGNGRCNTARRLNGSVSLTPHESKHGSN